MIDVRDLTFAYGNHEVLHEVSLQIPRARRDGFHRAVRLRENDLAALFQPDERSGRLRSRLRAARS